MDPQDTRSRLLDVAGQIFASKGVKSTTIRDIVQRAGANQAAVNYHFGDKEGLYAAVIEHSIRQACEECPFDGGVSPDRPPEERLEGVIHGFHRRILGPDSKNWRGLLIAREMENPSPTFLSVANKVFTPLEELLQAIIGQINPRLVNDEIWMQAHSVIAQCTFFCKMEAILQMTQPEFSRLDLEERIRRLTRHILRFSLNALRGQS